MNSFFVGKLEVTQPVQDNEGRLHAPPIHPGMPPPTLSGPREDPQAGTAVASASQSRGLFGNLFYFLLSAPAVPGIAVPGCIRSAACDHGHSGFFGNLFKPQKHGRSRGACPAGSCLSARLSPTPKPAKTETAKAEAPRPEQQRPEQQREPQKPELQQASVLQRPAPQVAQAPKPKPQQPQQDAAAAPPPANNGALIRGAQPVVLVGRSTAAGLDCSNREPVISSRKSDRAQSSDRSFPSHVFAVAMFEFFA